MQYGLILIKGKSRELYKLYDDMEKAERRANKFHKEQKDTEIIKVPDVRAGSRLYKNGIYKRTIIGETKNLWLLNNTENMEYIPDPVMKENLVNYFVQGYFTGDYEDVDSNYEMNFYKGQDDKDIEVDFIEDENNDTEDKAIV